MFSDQKFLKSRLSTEAHSMAVDVLKGLGNAHWVAAGLLAIANVLERFDNISANDRECIDLLKDMLKLGKYLKQMKDLNVKFHKEVLNDMREAVQLILSGAILCRSFITSNKLSKFLLTKKIRDELVYVRGKVNALKADLQGHMQLLMMKTLTFIQEQYITGRNEENICLGITEQNQSEDAQCEKTELDGSESDTVSSQGQDNCNDINGYKELKIPICISFQLGKFLRKRIQTMFGPRPKCSLPLELQMFVKEMHLPQIEFKFDELHKATKGFSQKLGEGIFGSIYSGNLSDGRRVAVKVVATNRDYCEIEWMNELRILPKLQHRNIVELVGYCFDNMMLVYDYMPRDLDRIILGEDEMIIDLPTRHNIILDIIRGLAYVHKGVDVYVVHRDIKPSNILLDENLNAKIGDFGIAQILQPRNAQYANKDISIETSVDGTVGYIDPDYWETSRVSLNSDIYSFGMLLLNVISGKRHIVVEPDIFFLIEEIYGFVYQCRHGGYMKKIALLS
ncbi:rust resistance kinase Lr10 isoform X2 [Cryptomeria japonica]|uniref:rust resistance kinase Lr10 isoform X2 n=1 Tax=Cryptomeria japonica TaxID=3369 RepID=UPI0027DA0CA6|nr:rust resistance kinase Lr10 isoform X2 [Cryptomeria japonica]